MFQNPLSEIKKCQYTKNRNTFAMQGYKFNYVN